MDTESKKIQPGVMDSQLPLHNQLQHTMNDLQSSNWHHIRIGDTDGSKSRKQLFSGVPKRSKIRRCELEYMKSSSFTVDTQLTNVSKSREVIDLNNNVKGAVDYERNDEVDGKTIETESKLVDINKNIDKFSETGSKRVDINKNIDKFSETGSKHVDMNKKIDKLSETGSKLVNINKNIDKFSETGSKHVYMNKNIDKFSETGSKHVDMNKNIDKLSEIRSKLVDMNKNIHKPSETGGKVVDKNRNIDKLTKTGSKLVDMNRNIDKLSETGSKLVDINRNIDKLTKTGSKLVDMNRNIDKLSETGSKLVDINKNIELRNAKETKICIKTEYSKSECKSLVNLNDDNDTVDARERKVVIKSKTGSVINSNNNIDAIQETHGIFKTEVDPDIGEVSGSNNNKVVAGGLRKQVDKGCGKRHKGFGVIVDLDSKHENLQLVKTEDHAVDVEIFKTNSGVHLKQFEESIYCSLCKRCVAKPVLSMHIQGFKHQQLKQEAESVKEGSSVHACLVQKDLRGKTDPYVIRKKPMKEKDTALIKYTRQELLQLQDVQASRHVPEGLNKEYFVDSVWSATEYKKRTSAPTSQTDIKCDKKRPAETFSKDTSPAESVKWKRRRLEDNRGMVNQQSYGYPQKKHRRARGSFFAYSNPNRSSYNRPCLQSNRSYPFHNFMPYDKSMGNWQWTSGDQLGYATNRYHWRSFKYNSTEMIRPDLHSSSDVEQRNKVTIVNNDKGKQSRTTKSSTCAPVTEKNIEGKFNDTKENDGKFQKGKENTTKQLEDKCKEMIENTIKNMDDSLQDKCRRIDDKRKERKGNPMKNLVDKCKKREENIFKAIENVYMEETCKRKEEHVVKAVRVDSSISNVVTIDNGVECTDEKNVKPEESQKHVGFLGIAINHKPETKTNNSLAVKDSSTIDPDSTVEKNNVKVKNTFAINAVYTVEKDHVKVNDTCAINAVSTVQSDIVRVKDTCAINTVSTVERDHVRVKDMCAVTAVSTVESDNIKVNDTCVINLESTIEIDNLQVKDTCTINPEISVESDNIKVNDTCAINPESTVESDKLQVKETCTINPLSTVESDNIRVKDTCAINAVSTVEKDHVRVKDTCAIIAECTVESDNIKVNDTCVINTKSTIEVDNLQVKDTCTINAEISFESDNIKVKDRCVMTPESTVESDNLQVKEICTIKPASEIISNNVTVKDSSKIQNEGLTILLSSHQTLQKKESNIGALKSLQCTDVDDNNALDVDKVKDINPVSATDQWEDCICCTEKKGQTNKKEDKDNKETTNASKGFNAYLKPQLESNSNVVVMDLKTSHEVIFIDEDESLDCIKICDVNDVERDNCKADKDIAVVDIHTDDEKRRKNSEMGSTDKDIVVIHTDDEVDNSNENIKCETEYCQGCKTNVKRDCFRGPFRGKRLRKKRKFQDFFGNGATGKMISKYKMMKSTAGREKSETEVSENVKEGNAFDESVVIIDSELKLETQRKVILDDPVESVDGEHYCNLAEGFDGNIDEIQFHHSGPCAISLTIAIPEHKNQMESDQTKIQKDPYILIKSYQLIEQALWRISSAIKKIKALMNTIKENSDVSKSE